MGPLPVLTLVTLALTAGAAQAQSGDPLQSADCRRALDALQVQEAEAATRRDKPALARLEAQRRSTARACLGARADAPAPPPARTARPAVAVPPIPIAPPLRPPATPPGPAAPSWKQLEPPTTVINCDATSCWASDGSRLQRAGPNLIGPRGLCSVEGTVLRCP